MRSADETPTKPFLLFDVPTIPLHFLRIVAVCPAHNEAESIGRTIESLLNQLRRLDKIIIVSDNSSDDTVKIASSYPGVTVVETEGNTHRKSGALNLAWNEHCQDADLIVGCDADTVLPPHAVRDWEQEFLRNPGLGGSSSQPVMTGYGLLPRIQRAEFAKSATISLRRGWCRVISGTGCCFRNEALREVARLPHQEFGPWSYESPVEDYHLTYRLRQLGWLAEMSPTVWVYTGSMTTVKSLWHQRIKWQAGTVTDLMRFGVSRLNWREWAQQIHAVLCIVFWILWFALNGTLIAAGHLVVSWVWLIFPVFFSVIELLHTRKIRGVDWKDYVIAGTLVSAFVYTGLAMAWITASWWKVLTGSRKDLWKAQYVAEGTDAQEEETVNA